MIMYGAYSKFRSSLSSELTCRPNYRVRPIEPPSRRTLLSFVPSSELGVNLVEYSGNQHVFVVIVS